MERRKVARKSVSFEVLVIIDEQTTLILEAANISENGVYLLTDGQPHPPIGAIVKVKLNGNIGSKIDDFPLVDMIIKRVDQDGLGLQYLKDHQAKRE